MKVQGTQTGPSQALVVDDEPDFRHFVSELLARLHLGTTEAGSGAEALGVARERRPALVVLDVRLPDVSGLEVCRELRDELGDGLPILLVSGEKTDGLDRSAGLLLGADDYLVKPLDPTEFLARVRRLVGRVRETGSVRNGTVRNGPATEYGVTPRERQVLALLAQGDDRRTIARKLAISPRTVGSHTQRLLGKLGVHSQAQAVAAAYREGLIDSPRASRRGAGPS